MKTTLLIMSLLYVYSALSLELGFWNLQNLHLADGNENIEFTPVNHPEKKKYCLQKEKWRKTQCLRRHWTKEKFFHRTVTIKKELEGFKPLDAWCFAEVGSQDILKELLDPNVYHFYGTKNNPHGQNIACAIKKNIAVSQLHIDRSLRSVRSRRKPLYLYLGQKKLHMLVFHLPSQFHPTSSRDEILEHWLEQMKGKQFIFLGDFNLTSSEQRAYQAYLIPFGKQQLIKGTYYFKKKRTYHYFDLLMSNLNCVEAKVLIPKDSLLDKIHIIPRSYNEQNQTGLSDHLPILGEISCL